MGKPLVSDKIAEREEKVNRNEAKPLVCVRLILIDRKYCATLVLVKVLFLPGLNCVRLPG